MRPQRTKRARQSHSCASPHISPPVSPSTSPSSAVIFRADYLVAPVKRLYVFGVITLIASIGVFATMGVTGIYTLGLAAYTFVTGLFFKDVAATYEANVAKLASEEAELKHAEEETAALRTKNKRIEEEKERARKAENDRLRDQQNAMFQQFMQQQMMNMQAGGATAQKAPENVAPATPAAPAATADTFETKAAEAPASTEGTTETTEKSE